MRFPPLPIYYHLPTICLETCYMPNRPYNPPYASFIQYLVVSLI